MELEKSERISNLLDVYKKLLTEHQQDTTDLYFNEDWSLSEIATFYNVSRNAVLSTIQRVSKTLEEYEEHLHIMKKFDQIRNELESSNLPLNEKQKLFKIIDE